MSEVLQLHPLLTSLDCRSRAEEFSRPVVVSDLDGTLLNSDGTLSKRTLAAVGRFQNAGGLLVLATARPLADALQFSLAFSKPVPLICQNGAVIYESDTGELMPTEYLTSGRVREIVDWIRSHSTGGRIAIDYLHDRIADPEWDGPVGRQPSQLTLWEIDSDSIPRRQATCIMVSGGSVDVDALASRFGVSATTSARGLTEIGGLNAKKESAMGRLCRHRELSETHVVAFGDMPNDIGLLQYSGVGVAVANADDAVLAAADRVVSSNDADGVAEFIDEMLGALV